ncbi:hypothetical protein AB0D04_04845 [Streptomyces sp. NPDC048483]|uniref:hypothetical protein n=1 Tax=Streptomyces sp. NPDC048483 TaxID=3154927 RepID=UPI003440AED1
MCTDDDSAAVAYNSATGRTRWSLPDETAGRVTPTVTLVRQGLVYGTTENGPVVLDAATGEDKEDKPGLAPYAMDGYVAVAMEDGLVSAHRVTGRPPF